MTPEQLSVIKERAEAAYLPGDLPTWAERDGYTLEYADGAQVAFYPTDTSGEGDYETYNRRQAAQVTFARHVREDVKALIAAVALRGQQIDDLSGRLSDAGSVIMAVRDWDRAGGDKGAESSRLLHNAYVYWLKALEERDRELKEIHDTSTQNIR